MGSLIPSNAIVMKNGHPVTTSRYVAEAFSKEHKNVLRDINELECSEEFAGLNFEPGSYLDANKQARPMYHLTKNGFMFLVMGFKGHEAARVKEDYIRAFDLLLEKQYAPQALPEPRPTETVDAMELQNLKLRLELAEMKLEKATRDLQPKRRPYTAEEEAKAISLIRQGFGPSEIGKRMGRTSASIDSLKGRLARDGRL